MGKHNWVTSRIRAGAVFGRLPFRTRLGSVVCPRRATFLSTASTSFINYDQKKKKGSLSSSLPSLPSLLSFSWHSFPIFADCFSLRAPSCIPFLLQNLPRPIPSHPLFYLYLQMCCLPLFITQHIQNMIPLHLAHLGLSSNVHISHPSHFPRPARHWQTHSFHLWTMFA